MHNRSQTSLEYLSTYAWVFIVLSVTIVALYYSGVFDFDVYLPEKCSFTSQFECIDFSLKPGEVKLKLSNNIGEDVSVVSLKITNEAENPLTCPTVNPQPPFDWAYETEEDFTFSSCTGGAYVSKERVDLRVSMEYYAKNTPSMPIHTIKGRINGKVLPG